MGLTYDPEWDFNWRFVIFHGSGHPPPKMFNHLQMGNALFGHPPEAVGTYRQLAALALGQSRRAGLDEESAAVLREVLQPGASPGRPPSVGGRQRGDDRR